MEARGVHALVVRFRQDRAGKAVRWLPAKGRKSWWWARRRMELYKEVGLPADVAARFGLRQRCRARTAIGHTRMATESAVTTDGAHPFSTGPDQCLVHNGSLSNHNAVRRRLRREGFTFRDRERHRGRRRLSDLAHDARVPASARRWKPRLPISTASILSSSAPRPASRVLRDPIACKPAVMAETERYVAFGTGIPRAGRICRASRGAGCGSRSPPRSMSGNAPT